MTHENKGGWPGDDSAAKYFGLPGLKIVKPRCPYCDKPMDQPVTRNIIDRGWDNVRRKQYVRKRDMEFCSDQCGSNYQMGCEG